MNAYQPKMAMHPGRTLRMQLGYYGVSNKWLADRTGLTEKHISEIVNEKAFISADTAVRLSKVLGGTVDFWVNLDANYRATKARLDAVKETEKDFDILDDFPYQILVKAGYIKDGSDKAEKVLILQRFFAVNSLDMVLDSQKMVLKKDKDDLISDRYLTAAWLRKGEIEAMNRSGNIEEYDRNRLMDSLPSIRKLAIRDFESTIEALISILNDNGVILTIVKPLDNVYINGATRWIVGSPVIQLTGRGKNNEEKWFTLFHEIGHIVLHGKKDRFMEYDDGFIDETDEEKELAADDFAKKQMFLSCIAD